LTENQPTQAKSESLSPRIRLQTRDLGLRRNGNWLFQNLELNISGGTFVAVLGPSGVGKSSLLSCLCGSEKPTEGTVKFKIDNEEDRDPESISPHLGVIFQSLRLTAHATVLDNVLYGRLGKYSLKETLWGFPQKSRQEAYAILEDLGIPHLAYKWMTQTSGGEQQRTAIARTLFHDPKIILADEPVSNLDTYYAGRILGLLRNKANQEGKIILCALHDPQLINRFADLALSLNPEHPEGWRLRKVHG
jgi:phosphonate transport system ATP-binding protein